MFLEIERASVCWAVRQKITTGGTTAIGVGNPHENFPGADTMYVLTDYASGSTTKM